jgi:GNAT superfamily N-acetyltransferase
MLQERDRAVPLNLGLRVVPPPRMGATSSTPSRMITRPPRLQSDHSAIAKPFCCRSQQNGGCNTALPGSIPLRVPMHVRVMSEDDVPGVGRLLDQLGYPIATERLAERFRLLSALPDNALFVVEAEDGGLAGWAHVYGHHLLVSADSCAEIGGLIVDTEARRQGAGRALMATVEAWALQHGYRDIRVRSGSERVGAHEFYQRLDYQFVKMQARFRKSL